MLILAVLVSLILIYTAIAYNNGIKLKNYVEEAFSTMDVYLKQRWDLIPNLVESVKAYAGHEQSVLTDITKLRSSNYSNLSDEQKIETNSALEGLLTKFVALAENYPELKANENFLQFNSQLNSIENDIANSRKYYNGTVRELNTYLEVFPTNVIGSFFKIQKAKMFQIDEAERQSVKVSFND